MDFLGGWSPVQTNPRCRAGSVHGGLVQEFSSHALQEDLEIPCHQSWTMCLWWTVHLQCMEPSPRWNHEAEKRWQLQVRTGHCWSHVLVWFNSTRSVWACISSAGLSLLWQPLQICLCQPSVRVLPPNCIHAFSNFSSSFSSSHWWSHYITQLPESIKRFLSSISNKKDNHDLLMHCKRELVHAVWKILLDNDFIQAYKNSIVVKCFDRITRRVYPRIFTYSADYPEKWVSLACLLTGYWMVWRVILATIQDKGLCPCPCCLIPKAMFHCTELVRDLAARLSHSRPYLQWLTKLSQCFAPFDCSLNNSGGQTPINKVLVYQWKHLPRAKLW